VLHCIAAGAVWE